MNIQYKRITRTIYVSCPTCWGTIHSDHVRCPTCNGTGEVSRTVTELVSAPLMGDEDNDALLGWAGSVL